MAKHCIKCGTLKELTEFHRHPTTKDGTLGKCKACVGAYVKGKYAEYKVDPIRMERIRGNKKKSLSKQRAVSYYQVHRQRFPEKFAARSASQKMVPLVPGNHLHHWSYRPEHGRDVVELSPSEHRAAHRHLVYDQERMQYRTTDGILLDTKEAHITWLKSKLPER